jgi:small subunit ribosomal protein S20
MANIKQQIKRNKTNEKARIYNASFRSSLKTSLKAVLKAVSAKDKEKATKLLSFAFKKLDKAQAKGIYHRNFVNRNKSSIASKVNALA